MVKKSINYKNLSKKELEYLKEMFVEEKVQSMDTKQLKEFVTENIRHQILNTIGHEEETEAWNEMESFFKEEFKVVIENIQKQFTSHANPSDALAGDININQDLSNNETDNEKVDMWDD